MRACLVHACVQVACVRAACILHLLCMSCTGLHVVYRLERLMQGGSADVVEQLAKVCPCRYRAYVPVGGIDRRCAVLSELRCARTAAPASPAEVCDLPAVRLDHERVRGDDDREIVDRARVHVHRLARAALLVECLTVFVISRHSGQICSVFRSATFLLQYHSPGTYPFGCIA